MKADEMDIGFQALSMDDISGGNESILIVDHETELRNQAKRILAAKGYRVFVAKDGDEAIRILEEEHIDLMLSDFMMHTMDNYMLTSVVQNRFTRVLIQMMTGPDVSLDSTVVDERLYEHALQKPYRGVELLARIRLLLDGDEAEPLPNKINPS